jgi:S1-C subfamily serine protease
MAIALAGLLFQVPIADAGSLLEQVEKEQQGLFEQIAPSVVFIAAKEGFGSGFFVDREGLVLTSAHVVGDRRMVDVVLYDGRKMQGQVVEVGRNNIDLALVQLSVKGVVALELSERTTVPVGTWIASVGHGLGGAWTFTTGMVTNIYPLGRDHPVFQTQIPLNPGNSGGPIVDRRGQVLGIVTSQVKNANSMNFAIRADKACDTLTGAANLCHRLVLLGPPDLVIFLDGKAVGAGPQVVMPAAYGTHEAFVVVKGQMRKMKFSYPAQARIDLSH